MKRRWGHMFNMFIMKKELVDEYCSFLFEFLEKLESEISQDVLDYNLFQARVYGRISEFMLDVWIDSRGYSYKELGFLYMESINWNQKIKKFLKSKFLHQYY
ncbi:Glycosyltransferase [Lachnospiraceae bacterium TWA4]|nr:Glycosyltransferase [Lachnospiraceae bacterium TWA4]